MCPLRHNYQLPWLKMKLSSALPGSPIHWKSCPLYQLEKNGKDWSVLFTFIFRKPENFWGFRVTECQRAAMPVASQLFDPENSLYFYNYLTEEIHRGRNVNRSSVKLSVKLLLLIQWQHLKNSSNLWEIGHFSNAQPTLQTSLWNHLKFQSLQARRISDLYYLPILHLMKWRSRT